MSEDNNKKWYQEDEIFNEKGQHIALWWLIHDKETDNIIKKMASEDDKSKLVLKINYATSAFGSIMIELLKSESKATNNDDNGKSSSDDVTKLLQSKTMYGDDLEEIVIWEKTKEGSGGGGDDIKDIILNSKKSGHMLFLKFNLEDADVFAWKFDV